MTFGDRSAPTDGGAASSTSGDRLPVLLLHGIWKTGAAFAVLEARLRSAGFTTRAIDLEPNDGSAPIRALAERALSEADRAFGASARLNLVGFSMGGLVARYIVQRLGGLERVARLVTLGTPHHGTLAAHLARSPGALDMRLGSLLLRDLERDVSSLEAIDVTSIWTPLDLMIVPATSSRLPVGRDVVIAAPFHAWLLRDRRSVGAAVEALEAPAGSRSGARRPAP